MRNFICVYWNPQSGKTTIANHIAEQGFTVLNLDSLYTKRIINNKPRLYGYNNSNDSAPNIFNRMMNHVWGLNKEHQDEFFRYVLIRIDVTEGDIILEWRHHDIFLHKLKMWLLDKFNVTDIIMNKRGQCLVQPWYSYPRAELYPELDRILWHLYPKNKDEIVGSDPSLQQPEANPTSDKERRADNNDPVWADNSEWLKQGLNKETVREEQKKIPKGSTPTKPVSK
jgi:hypothetical protein